MKYIAAQRDPPPPPKKTKTALGIDPGYLRFAYRAPLAPDARGPEIFLVRLKALRATRPLVPPGRRCARKKNMATKFARFAL